MKTAHSKEQNSEKFGTQKATTIINQTKGSSPKTKNSANKK